LRDEVFGWEIAYSLGHRAFPQAIRSHIQH